MAKHWSGRLGWDTNDIIWDIRLEDQISERCQCPRTVSRLWRTSGSIFTHPLLSNSNSRFVWTQRASTLSLEYVLLQGTKQPWKYCKYRFLALRNLPLTIYHHECRLQKIQKILASLTALLNLFELLLLDLKLLYGTPPPSPPFLWKN